MDYVAYLEPVAMEVHQLVKQKVKITENGGTCRKFDIFGYFDTGKRELTICTARILRVEDSARHINETLLHESVHVAQSCKGRFRSMQAFGINSSAMVLTASRESDLGQAYKYARSLGRAELRQIEREAFWMENKPKEVRYVVKKYCF